MYVRLGTNSKSGPVAGVFPKRPSVGFLAVGFVLLNVVDICLTAFIFQHGGYELNPLIRAALRLGLPTAVCLKVGASAVFAWVLYRFRREEALKVAAALISGVCLFNVVGLAVLSR